MYIFGKSNSFIEEELSIFLELINKIENDLSYIKDDVNLKNDIIEPLIKIFDILDIDYVYNKKNNYLWTNSSRFKDLQYLWFNGIIFERYIEEIIRKYDFEVAKSSIICFNPKNNYYIKNLKGNSQEKILVKGTFEVDIIAKTSNKIIIVECKNGPVRQNQFFKFLGKIKVFKEVYKIDDKKIIPIIISNYKFPDYLNTKELNINCKIFHKGDFKQNYRLFEKSLEQIKYKS